MRFNQLVVGRCLSNLSIKTLTLPTQSQLRKCQIHISVVLILVWVVGVPDIFSVLVPVEQDGVHHRSPPHLLLLIR